MGFECSALHMIDEKDLRIDVYRPAQPGWSVGNVTHLRITHIPSGLVMSREVPRGQSNLQAKREMLEEMEEILHAN